MTFNFLAGQKPDAGRFGEFGTYTPQLLATTTNPNLGANGEAIGRFARNGPIHVAGWARFLFDGSGLAAGSGTYMFTLPLPPNASFHTFSPVVAAATHIGGGFIEDASTTANRESIELYLRETPNRVGMRTASGASITNANPFTWAAGDRISVHFSYMIELGT